MTISTPVISHDEFRAIIQRAILGRATTLPEEAAPYSVADLHGTALFIYRELRHLLETLPDSAFEPNRAGGDTRWSAGQIIAHTVEYQINTFLRAARLAVGMPSGPEMPTYPDHAAIPAFSRENALALLDLGDRELEDILLSLPLSADVSATREAAVIGQASYKSALLFAALHADDHLEQLRALAG
jgi:hypothetical protein